MLRLLLYSCHQLNIPIENNPVMNGPALGNVLFTKWFFDLNERVIQGKMFVYV